MITYRKIAITIIILQFFIGIPILTYIDPFPAILSFGAFQYDMVVAITIPVIFTIITCRYITSLLQALVENNNITVGIYHRVVEEIDSCIMLSYAAGFGAIAAFLILPERDIAFLNSIMVWVITISSLLFIDSIRGLLKVGAFWFSVRDR